MSGDLGTPHWGPERGNREQLFLCLVLAQSPCSRLKSRNIFSSCSRLSCLLPGPKCCSHNCPPSMDTIFPSLLCIPWPHYHRGKLASLPSGEIEAKDRVGSVASSCLSEGRWHCPNVAHSTTFDLLHMLLVSVTAHGGQGCC